MENKWEKFYNNRRIMMMIIYLGDGDNGSWGWKQWRGYGNSKVVMIF